MDPRLRVWHQLRGQSGPVRRIDIHDSPVFASGAIAIGQFTALVGLHGAGKSYLISMIDSALPGWQARHNLPVDLDDHDSGLRGRYTIELSRTGDVEHLTVERPMHWRERKDWDESMRPILCTLLTPYHALWELSFVADNWGPKGPPEPTEFVQFTRRELDVVGRITGHEYERLEWGIIDTDESFFPLMRGVRESRPVDTWSMSSSEFWVLYVLWCLGRTDEHEVVLIDEPETFLAPPGHRAFVDEIARVTLAKGCQTVVATHSESMLRCIPDECMVLVTSGHDGAELSRVSGVQSVLRALSRRPTTPTTIVLAEDGLGVRIARAILRRFATERADEFDVVDCGGKDEARRAARVVGRSERIRAVALLDGDERTRSGGDDTLFLPGQRRPEVELTDGLRSCLDEASAAFRVQRGDLLAALDLIRFVHHQAVFSTMAAALGGRSGSDVEATAITLWLNLPDVAFAAEELAQHLISRLPAAVP